MVHAIGWAGLFNGFKGAKDKPVQWADFLPYSQEDDAALSQMRVSKRTAQIFADMYQSGQIPAHVIGAASGLIDEIESLSRVEIR